MNEKYILIGKKAIPEPDIMKWGAWFEGADRHVRLHEFRGVDVSTVFLGLDHRFGGGAPILFETMIFTNKAAGVLWQEDSIDGYQTRCSTYDEAVEMHLEAIRYLKRQRDEAIKKVYDRHRQKSS